MPRNKEIKKVLVIGSGPIIIGQAAEFDYAGTQACRSLKEEGLEVVLLNSNPATIMTDKDIADHVYIEPLNIPSVTQVIEKEKPDSILPTLGGQTGLDGLLDLPQLPGGALLLLGQLAQPLGLTLPPGCAAPPPFHPAGPGTVSPVPSGSPSPAQSPGAAGPDPPGPTWPRRTGPWPWRPPGAPPG